MSTFAPDRLHQFVVSVVRALGSDGDEPTLVADQLIQANLSGHDSHGIGMLPTYVNAVAAGLLSLNAETEAVIDSGPVMVFDGHFGFGQVAGFRAMTAGIQRAKEQGVALVGLRNSFHVGRIGHWGEQAVASGLASIHFVNVAGHEPLVAPHGGASARFGTNPVCIAIPADGGVPAALLDMATSTIALGKTRVAKNRGEPVPAGTVLDPSGELTTDPNVMWNDDGPKGALVAMGDHKGSGLALMCEILGAALIGGMTVHPKYERTGAIINNMLSILIDPAAVGSAETLSTEASGFLQYAQNATRRAGFDEILLPGEPEARARRERHEGIVVEDATVAELNAAARSINVSPLT